MSFLLNALIGVSRKAVPPQPLLARRYDAASKTARLSGWRTPGTDADAANADPQTIRNRCRDLVRNNPWAAKGVSVIVNNAVGFGIRANITAGSKLRTRRAQDLWQAWAETTACDADGLLDFYGIQALAFRSLIESGECLIRLRPRRPEDGLPVPMQLQLLEPDMIADDAYVLTRANPNTGNTIYRGIEFDPLGRRVAYWLYRIHPGADTLEYSSEITRVPATEIIHLFRRDRPGQDRGVSWLAPVVVTLRELGIYEDALLKRQQIANLFAGFITSDDPAAFEAELNDELPDLQPGTMYMLANGRSVTFNEPPKAESDPAFRDACLRAIAAGLGVTYESLTGNLSEVNFSSARLGAMEFGRSLDAWAWNLFIPRVCQGVFAWFQQMATASGVDLTDARAEWTPPSRTLVDPAKEFNALLTAVKTGVMSLPEAIRSQGYDPVALAEEQAEYLGVLDSLGIKVESDYRNSIKTQPEQPQPEAVNA